MPPPGYWAVDAAEARLARVLVTNDDGIRSPGLSALVRAAGAIPADSMPSSFVTRMRMRQRYRQARDRLLAGDAWGRLVARRSDGSVRHLESANSGRTERDRNALQEQLW